MRKEVRTLKAKFCLIHLIPGLGLPLSETKAVMAPRELGWGGSAAADLGCSLSSSAGSSEGVDQGFSWEPELPGKWAKMLAHFTPVTKATVLMKESLWVWSSYILHALLLAPTAYTSWLFFLKTNPPWRSASLGDGRKEARRQSGPSLVLIPAPLQDKWMVESKSTTLRRSFLNHSFFLCETLDSALKILPTPYSGIKM